MPRSLPRDPFLRVGFALLTVTHLLGACGGKSASVDGDDDGNAKGGTSGSTGANGGTGGGDIPGKGGSDLPGSGGTDIPGKGGTGAGGTDSASGGTGGPTPNCEGIDCAPLPTTCKQVVQPPNACCPICKETGCDPCTLADCDPGYHAEQLPGDCCETCVADPVDACESGQAAYAQLRGALLEKYSSLGCRNSTECGLVTDEPACITACPVALPTSTIESWESNTAAAADACSTCLALPGPVLCKPVVASCINGLCNVVPDP
jgi:hypothetical protein